MPCTKRYEAHCPSPTCTGRDRNKLYPIRGKPNWLPLGVWVQKKDDEILYRCAYCGLDAKPVGYYDDFQHPWEFVSLKGEYRIREQNTSRYWFNVGSKSGAIHPPKRGGMD
jgi:hypothetical protein